MNGSNSFNICPRCGNSNALNAKYCARCGAQLKIPEEPVVCHKCHTRNTPMANFCRNCGATLKVGAETKICPKCGKEVDASENVCVCGYSFVTLQQTVPSSKSEDTSNGSVTGKNGKVKKGKKKYNTKGGRGWAIAAMVFILLFAYLAIAPALARPDFLQAFDKGFVFMNSEEGTTLPPFYGFDFIAVLATVIIVAVSGQDLGETIGEFGIGNYMIIALTVAFIVTVSVHLIVAFVRCFTTKRSKRMNWYFLVMAILSTLVVGLITVFGHVHVSGDVLSKVAGWFDINSGFGNSVGFAIWLIPIYFWFFYLYSLCAKAKVVKEKAE